MTEPLSPAAQAVLDAVSSQMEGGWISPDFIPYEAKKIAAALQSAADQLFPEPDDWVKDNMSEQGLWLLRLKRDQLLAIAAELEGDSSQ